MGLEMHLKGMEKVRKKLPGYPGWRLAFVPLLMLGMAVLGLAFLLLLDILPRILVQMSFLALVEPMLPIVAMAILLYIGLWLVWGVWRKKDELIAEHGELAYQRVIPRGISGIGLMFACLVHMFVSVRSLPPGPPVNELTTLFSQSLLPLVGIPIEIDTPLRIVLSSFFAFLGLLTMRRAVLTFGIDYMIVIYLYFPHESEIQQREIYSIIRHPTYFAGILLGISAMLFRMSIYAIIFFVLFYAAWRAQISVEEKELVERFGEGYSNYMKKVPGLRVNPGDFGTYVRFLLGRSEESE
jgi:protein-S-isoprenylcysteine O-methyltransferase Ste14